MMKRRYTGVEETRQQLPSPLDELGANPVLAVDTAPITCWLEGHPRLADRFAPE